MPEKAIPIEAEFTLLKKDIAGMRVRGAARYRCALATLGRLVFAGGANWDAWVHNLSETGIGLNLEQPLDIGTALTIHLKSSSRSFHVSGQVIHSTPQADGTWRVGCRLDERLTPEILDELL